MAESYVRERIRLFGELCKEGALEGRIWMLEPEDLRFKHGESIAELKIPYHMGADDEACVEEAVLSLASLLIKRFESTHSEATRDGYSAPALPHAPPLKEKTYRTDIFISGSFEKRLAVEVLSNTPYVDSAILSSWLNPEGQGRRFVKWVTELFDKVLKDEAVHGTKERTTYLALLAAVNTIAKKKERLKEVRVRGLSYDRLDMAVGLTLFVTFKAALKELFARLKGSGAYYHNPSVETLLGSALLPRYFLSIPSNILSITLNPYGLSSESYEALKGIAAPLEEFNAGFEALMDSALQGLKKEPGVLETLRAQHGITLFREEALKYMMALDIPGTASQELIYNIYNEDRLIRNCLTDEGSKEGLIKSLEGIRALVGKDHERARAVEDFEAYLASTRKGVFGGLLKGAKKDVLHSVAPVVEGYFALAIDCRIERFVDLMRRSLADRRPEFSQNTLLEEYNRGRLYRFSTDTRPVVKSLEVAEEGQLFVDMKDFTRKTLKVKEIAMADFMKEYFYKPILKAASRYSSGSGLTENERGIRLTNIPGDAAIFSGGVSNLVSLARDIQRIIRENRKGLEERLPPKKDTEVLEKVHKSFEARREELKRKRLEMTRELAGDSQGSETRLIALGEEENRIESTYREELENAIKGELETGLYVSYGAKAETMVMESTDGFYGPVKVSIGEKINEASRGTYRHPMVRANLEMLLAGERERRKNRETKYPFDIYIHTTYSLRMPPEIENAFERLVATRKLSNAKALAQLISEDYMSDLEKIISGEPFSSLRLVTAITDIYNKGQALSEAALMAYMKETRGVKRFFNRVVPVKELHPSIQEAFFFPADPLELFLGAGVIKGATEAEGFLKSGEVIFRGFETSPPTVIYEMLDPEGDFFISLVRHHLSDWLEEAKEEGEGERI